MLAADEDARPRLLFYTCQECGRQEKPRDTHQVSVTLGTELGLMISHISCHRILTVIWAEFPFTDELMNNEGSEKLRNSSEYHPRGFWWNGG